jgi:hypothetical protein
LAIAGAGVPQIVAVTGHSLKDAEANRRTTNHQIPNHGYPWIQNSS